MSEKIYVIPAANLRVVNPANGQPLPPEGDTVERDDTYWIRRINDGDVTEGTAPVAAAATAAAPKATSKKE